MAIIDDPRKSKIKVAQPKSGLQSGSEAAPSASIFDGGSRPEAQSDGSFSPQPNDIALGGNAPIPGTHDVTKAVDRAIGTAGARDKSGAYQSGEHAGQTAGQVTQTAVDRTNEHNADLETDRAASDATGNPWNSHSRSTGGFKPTTMSGGSGFALRSSAEVTERLRHAHQDAATRTEDRRLANEQWRQGHHNAVARAKERQIARKGGIPAPTSSQPRDRSGSGARIAAAHGQPKRFTPPTPPPPATREEINTVNKPRDRSGSGARIAAAPTLPSPKRETIADFSKRQADALRRPQRNATSAGASKPRPFDFAPLGGGLPDNLPPVVIPQSTTVSSDRAVGAVRRASEKRDAIGKWIMGAPTASITSK